MGDLHEFPAHRSDSVRWSNGFADSDAHGGKVAGVFAGGIGNPLKKADIVFPENNVFEDKIEDTSEYDSDQGRG